MDIDYLDLTLVFCSDNDDVCLTNDVFFNPNHEFHVVGIVVQHSCDCLSIFVSVFSEFVAKINNTCCYDHSI